MRILSFIALQPQFMIKFTYLCKQYEEKELNSIFREIDFN